MSAMAEISNPKVLPYRSARTRQEWTAQIGMFLFLGSWAMMFAALFFVYGGLRARAQVWPPVEYPPLPLLHGLLNTVVVAFSSAALIYAVRALHAHASRRFVGGLVAATVLGLCFLGSQVVLWSNLYGEGLRLTSGTYGATLYGFTALHAAHVLVGVGALGFVVVRAMSGVYTPARCLGLRLWSLYWHFVGAVWLFLFVTIFVL
ncbi:MAG: heme-copper oxidase subunit III [Myxococcota bacterium]